MEKICNSAKSIIIYVTYSLLCFMIVWLAIGSGFSTSYVADDIWKNLLVGCVFILLVYQVRTIFKK